MWEHGVRFSIMLCLWTFARPKELRLGTRIVCFAAVAGKTVAIIPTSYAAEAAAVTETNLIFSMRQSRTV